MDGKEIEVEAYNFTVACVLAAYSRVVCGDRHARQLMVDQSKSYVIKASK